MTKESRPYVLTDLLEGQGNPSGPFSYWLSSLWSWSAVLKLGTSTACSPDNLNILHFRHLGPSGINDLTDLYNLSLANSEMPAVWKLAAIAEIINQGTSYLLISLSQGLWAAPAALPDRCPPCGSLYMGSVLRAPQPLCSSLLHTGLWRGLSSANPLPHSSPCRLFFQGLWYGASWPSPQHQKVAVHLRSRAVCCSVYRSINAVVPQGSVISPLSI